VKKPVIGHIEGVEVRDEFPSYPALNKAKVHRAPEAGIFGTIRHGAESIVLNGKYDDKDEGSRIIYTGHGGLGPDGKTQIADQHMNDHGNAALRTSWIRGLPIRVIRGWRHKSEHSPSEGYRYAGLFRIVKEPWREPHPRDKFLICRFELEQLTEPPTADTVEKSHRTRGSTARGGITNRLTEWVCNCEAQGSLSSISTWPPICPECGASEGQGLKLK
jgi:putative restriction endonuclease